MMRLISGLLVVLALCVRARADPGSEDKWAIAPLPMRVQFSPAPDDEFIRSLSGRFGDEAMRTWLLPLRNLIHENYYHDVADAALIQGALSGDPRGLEPNAVYGAMKGMVAALGDPHSWIKNPQEFGEFMKMYQGTRRSPGFVYGPDPASGGLAVLAVYRDSRGGGPAVRAGIEVGDRIVSTPVQQGNQWIVDLVKRNGARAKVAVDLEEISFPDVAPHLFADKNIGYIYVQHFGPTGRYGTEDNFEYQLGQLNARSLRGLIVDLRDNPGGNTETCIQMAALFLPAKATVVLRKEKNGPLARWGDTSGQDGAYASGPPLAVLINGPSPQGTGSASCSEIFAAAMQDQHRAAIIGSCSYGKGVTQLVGPFRGGAGFSLTTEEWFRITGKSVQGVGVCPDPGREVGDTGEEKQRLSSRVEAQVYGESRLLYGDPAIEKAFEYFGVR